MKNFIFFTLLLSICILDLCPAPVFCQGGWERLPNYDRITIGISYSHYNNSIPDSTFGSKPGVLSKSVYIPSLAFHTDKNEGYSRWQPSVSLVGDLVWAAIDDEVNMSILTGGLFGNYDRGINFIQQPKLRVGAGGTVEDYGLVTNTYDQGYHLGLGPNVKCDYLLSESMYARCIVKYVFSIYHFVGSKAKNKTLNENAKHPHFFTLDAQLITRWGINIRIEYWDAISKEDSALKVDRFWIHLAMGL